MKNLHPTLSRQLRKVFGDTNDLPEKVTELLELIDKTYRHVDEDRQLMERSLEISSLELETKNKRLQKELDDVTASKAQIKGLTEAQEQIKAKAEELEEMNKFMVGRELKMAQLKEKVAELEKIIQELGHTKKQP